MALFPELGLSAYSNEDLFHQDALLDAAIEGLREVVDRNSRAGRLRFTSSYGDAVPTAEFFFIAVSTPEGEGGQADVSARETFSVNAWCEGL